MAAAAHVVNLTGTRLEGELPERFDEVVAVDVVAHLLAFVAEHAIGAAGSSTFHEVGEKAVKFGARVRRAGKAATAKDRRLHAEVTAVFLSQDVRGHLAGTKKRVLGLVDGH